MSVCMVFLMQCDAQRPPLNARCAGRRQGPCTLIYLGHQLSGTSAWFWRLDHRHKSEGCVQRPSSLRAVLAACVLVVLLRVTIFFHATITELDSARLVLDALEHCAHSMSR